jgi:predicted metal-binding membrane protein
MGLGRKRIPLSAGATFRSRRRVSATGASHGGSPIAASPQVPADDASRRGDGAAQAQRRSIFGAGGRSSRQQAVFGALLAALALACWAALASWSASPYARYLEHPGWADAASFATFCRAAAVPAGVHAIAWLLMIGAMMLPTTYPLVGTFSRITAARADHATLVVLVVAGFFAAWLAFGVLAYALDAVVRAIAVRSGWFIAHGQWVAAGILAAAGAFQFSALKYRCLEACHSPFSFVASHWHGRAPRREALRLGFDHGVFCVGCCWALMLVMFVVGMGSLGWMLALAAVMAAEKNLPGGRRLATPIGLSLIGAAIALALSGG